MRVQSTLFYGSASVKGAGKVQKMKKNEMEVSTVGGRRYNRKNALGDLEKELKDTDCPEWHLREAEIIEDMREDYSILVDVIHTLKPTEQKLLLPYLTYEKSLRDIADEAGILYESAAVKITRIRTKVRKDAANSLANKYSIYEEEN